MKILEEKKETLEEYNIILKIHDNIEWIFIFFYFRNASYLNLLPRNCQTQKNHFEKPIYHICPRSLKKYRAHSCSSLHFHPMGWFYQQHRHTGKTFIQIYILKTNLIRSNRIIINEDWARIEWQYSLAVKTYIPDNSDPEGCANHQTMLNNFATKCPRSLDPFHAVAYYIK